MRICLATTTYPPAGTGGIPRQRQILANGLVKLGHEVHIITQGKRQGTTLQNGVTIHTVPLVQHPLLFSEKYPSLNQRLTHSLAIQEQTRALMHERQLDILDVPLWGLEGLVPIYADTMPVALWLQTSFAQLVASGQQSPGADDAGVIALEKECLQRARGIIADSHAVLDDFEKLYHLNDMQNKSRVVHLGLPDLPVPHREKRREGDGIEALVVGRLEKRKGTPHIFEILPEMIRSDDRLRVRFIGADNSRWDGFYQQVGQTYPEYFHSHWPGLRNKVIFEGQVSDWRLIEAYSRADLMLVPSQYESFGLIFLEAMRAGLPVVTFQLDAASEIFSSREDDGALLVSPQDYAAFQSAALSLLQDGQKRASIGACGREHFARNFTDTHMAEETVAFYQEMVKAPQGKVMRPRRVFQVMEALDAGDAVSAIALRNAALLQQMHTGGTILSLSQHPDLVGKSRPVNQFDVESNSALIFHYWNYSRLEAFIRSFPGPKAMHYHNITPPEFFSPGSPGYEATTRGYAQLPEMLDLFDLLIGDSAFNLESCRPFLKSSKPGIVIPPVIEAEEVRARPYDAQLLAQLQQQPGLKILFVGRIARNKRQDRLIELFTRLGSEQAWLYLVGGDQGDPQYRQELEVLRDKIPGKERIVFTGKVSEAALYSYYRAAGVFVSASEHEGFGMPLIEAMALDIPVVAYAAGAVPETMGAAGVLVKAWDNEGIAGQIIKTTHDTTFREHLLADQRENLQRFTETAVRKYLSAAVRFLQDQEQDERLMVTIG